MPNAVPLWTSDSSPLAFVRALMRLFWSTFCPVSVNSSYLRVCMYVWIYFRLKANTWAICRQLLPVADSAVACCYSFVVAIFCFFLSYFSCWHATGRCWRCCAGVCPHFAGINESADNFYTDILPLKVIYLVVAVALKAVAMANKRVGHPMKNTYIHMIIQMISWSTGTSPSVVRI